MDRACTLDSSSPEGRRRHLVRLEVIGVVSARQIKWFESFSIPGTPLRGETATLKDFGSGPEQPHRRRRDNEGRRDEASPASTGDPGRIKANPRARSSSYFSTGSTTYVSKDKQRRCGDLRPGTPGLALEVKRTRAARPRPQPPGATVHVTGTTRSSAAPTRETTPPAILGETLIGGLGRVDHPALRVGTGLPRIRRHSIRTALDPQHVHARLSADPTITDVSIIVQFLIALVGLGVSIDYALLIISVPRELRTWNSTDDAIVASDAARGSLGNRLGLHRGRSVCSAWCCFPCRSSGRSASAGC